MKVNGKVMVVTGGGSGMGRALALQLLARGARVAIVDINTAGMEETAKLAGELGSKLSIHTLDITDQNRVNEFPAEVMDKHGGVDGLINNAGIIQPFVKVNDLDYTTIERVMNINFYGTLYLVKAFLPHLLNRPEAHIANVSSMGGFVPVPGQTVYGASKAAVKLFTEGLHSELRGTPVKVTLILPGAVNTNITVNSGVEAPGAGSSEDTGMKMLEADEAARIMLEAIEKDKYRVLVGKDARSMDKLFRLSPRRAAALIADKMKDLLEGS